MQNGKNGKNPLRLPIANTSTNQYEKDMAVYAVRDAVGRLENIQKLAAPWINSLKVHASALPLAEFTGVIAVCEVQGLAATALGEPWRPWSA